MTQKTREQLEDMWLTHFEPILPPNYIGDSDDERAMALLIDKMSVKLKDPDFIILRKESKDDNKIEENIEEIKKAVKLIEQKPGFLGQLVRAFLLITGLIVVINVIVELSK